MEIGVYGVVNQLNKLPLSIRKKIVRMESMEDSFSDLANPKSPISILNKVFLSSIILNNRDSQSSYIFIVEGCNLRINICNISNLLNRMSLQNRRLSVGNMELSYIANNILTLDDDKQKPIIVNYRSYMSRQGALCSVAIINTILGGLIKNHKIVPKVDHSEEGEILYFVVD